MTSSEVSEHSAVALQRRLNMTEVVSGVLALVVVGGVVFIACYNSVVRGTVPDLPSWLTAVVGAIVGAYFGARASSVTNGHS